MDRVLVAYASRMGSTAEIAERIGDQLREAGYAVTVAPCTDAPPASEFVAVVVGSAIYVRRWLPSAVRYLRRQVRRGGARPTYLFQSGPCGKPAESVVHVQRAVRRLATRLGADAPVSFPGRLDPTLAKDPVSRWVATGSMAGDYRDWDAIANWTARIVADLGAGRARTDSGG